MTRHRRWFARPVVRSLSTLTWSLALLSACGDQPAPSGPVSATVPPPVAPVSSTSTYDMQLRFIGSGATPRMREAFSKSVARWREIITTDIGTTRLDAPAADCQEWIPAVAESVNDLLVFVRVTSIDGPGKTVAKASPCFVNSETKLPIMGFFEIDVDDVRLLEEYGTLDDVVLHELGHVLGIGTLWNYKRTLLVGAGTDNPYFTGSGARAAFGAGGGALFPGDIVPVENTGAQGTRDVHWRATVFGAELMQGFAVPGGMPLSRVTVASLADLGYKVNMAKASAFSFAAALRIGAASGERVALGDDIAQAPLIEVDARGVHRLVPPPQQ
ncbi:hypothetical protein [Gemmatimonas sp.]|uniref:hypothetical protein n=1 Tax=Gemmatimonas sp. TaxID=1962908 RepID=UPI003342DA49